MQLQNDRTLSAAHFHNFNATAGIFRQASVIPQRFELLPNFGSTERQI